MGAHTDPDTLAFIEYLRKRGLELGFCTYTEYKPCDNQYHIDVVWKLQGSQNPLFTFEVETIDNERVFSNTAKIFDTSSSLVPKPWRHFMIIYKSKLSHGHKDMLHRVLHQHNVLLFEDIFNQKTEKERLDEALNDCAYDISELITSQVISKPLGQTIPLFLNSLKRGLEGFPITNPDLSLTVKSNEPPKGAIKFKIITQTSKGEKTFLEKLRESEEPLEPFSLEAPQLKDFICEDKKVFAENSKIVKLTVVPAPMLKRTKIMIRNSSVVLDDFILRKTKTEGSKIFVSTENRNLPFVFQLQISVNNSDDGIDFRLDQTKANVKQALQYVQFIKDLNVNKELIIIDKETNALLFTLNTQQTVEQSEQWYDLLCKLAYIQEKTNHPIPCPSKITKDDYQNMIQVMNIVNTGAVEISINYFSITVDKKGAKQLIDLFKKEGKILNMTASVQSTSVDICGEVIPLGPNKMSLPDMKFKKPLVQLEQLVERMPIKAFKKITLIPINEKRMKVRYENWLPTNKISDNPTT